MHEGQAFMTTSCCPAYTGWVEKHAPMLKPFVSETRSPMVYAARYAKENTPTPKSSSSVPALPNATRPTPFPRWTTS